MSESPAVKFIAGVGASAGGLESLERFFRNVPVDSGVAFIVVQHLSADHKSLMVELIARFTRIPVSDARDGEEIRPDHIYLLSPGKELEVNGTQLAVFQRNPERALAFPIDRLLVSLADFHGPRSIAVILSGSGSDGSRGVRRVDAMGGLVLVEDPALAAFDGMPSAAIETGAAMAVLAADALAQSLVDHVSMGPMPAGEDVAALEDIIRLLKRKLGVDFDEYKRGTLFRRVMRRAQLRDMPTLGAYEDLLEHDTGELRALHYDLLIGVTSFFRDPEAFGALAEQIGECVRSPVEPTRELRTWTAGCATGEEAYSIAILFDEAIRRAGSARTFKVFATDVHPGALEIASTGIFSPERLDHVGAERLREYFIERPDGRLQIAPSIRNKVVFARHDLLTDTPFTNLDVVSCRNMLIYLKPQAQRRAIASLAYGLRVGGVFFLGSSETPGEMSPHFDVINEKGKLYRKRVHSRGMHRPEIPTKVGRRSGILSEPVRPETRLLPMYDALLDRFMPPSFLVSEQRTLLDSYGGAEKLLGVARRRPTGDFLEMVPETARMAVAGVLARAQREVGPASYSGISWATDTESLRFRVQAERLLLRNAEPAYVLTLIEHKAVEPTAEPAEGAASPGDMERLTHLEEELANARVSLQSTVEELEASNEELQATNEELIASNEELQSVNEELHSVNEELHTVNAEHQLKIGELTELNRDIGHLLESIDVATIYLDGDLKIRKYTPRAGTLFGLVEHDVGRYLASFNHQLYYPGLMDDVKSVRDGGGRVEKEVRSREDRWYFVRLLSYRVGGGIEGVVVTLTDASALAAAKERALQLSSIVESSGDAIIGLTLEGRITSWNAAASRIYGYPDSEMIGESILTLIPEEGHGTERQMLAQIAAGSDLINIVVKRCSKAGLLLEIATTMSPVRDSQGIVIGIATIDRDIREQKELERRLRESEGRYEDLYHNAPDIYLSVDTRSGRIREFNDTFLRVTEFLREEAQAMYFMDLHPAAAQDAALALLARFREGSPVNDLPVSIRRKSKADLDAALSATSIYALDGTVIGARAVLRDVSERRRAELDMAQASQMREQFLAMVSHELRSPLHAINASFQIIDSAEADEGQRERSEIVVRRQTRQMIRLVDDLLDVSRIIHGKLQIERLPVDLGEVARSALDALAPAFHGKGIRLVSDGLDVPLPMFGDAGRLEQVLANLLNNSLRYTNAGRQVRVSCKREANGCEISVADEGSGIAEADLKNIFDMFTQSRQGIARSEGGLGLGLTIAERIVSAHGGSLVAKSDGVGRGAQFTIKLLLDPSAAKVKPAKLGNGRLSIVLVEDQDDARETLKVLLNLEGHEVHAAGDGQLGLSLILAQRPQIGLLDIGLPQMNGYELAKEIRQRMGDSIKLVAMSGYGQPEDVRAAEAAGFDRHLTKPLDPRKLAAALREMGVEGYS
jgi:two-component system CheB/CheR fusion protein